MDQATSNVLRRFLARCVQADDRFRPPKSVVNAVETGKLDAHVLLFWKDCVEKISQSPQGWKDGGGSYAAAIAYWRSKCAKNGYPLPNEYVHGLGGKGSQGRWSVKAGDEIEEWVKQTMYSQNLIAQLAKTADEMRMEVSHLKRLLDDAHDRVGKHMTSMGNAKTPKGVAQKKQWFEEAMADVRKFEKELATAVESLGTLKDTAEDKPKADNYSIEFEKEFQFRMTVAAKTIDKVAVIEAVKKAVARFEQGLEMPGPYEAPEGDEPDWSQARQAGILESIGGFLFKSWNYLRGAFDLFNDWVSGIGDDTKALATLLKEAGAPE